MTESANPICPVMMVDDEEQALHGFEMALRSARMNNFIQCQDSRTVMPLLASQDVEVILLDLRMPHITGEELLPKITSDMPEIPVIIITGANDVETAVKCMKHGAFDYMVKPVEKSRLVSGVQRAIELRELQRENRRLKAHVLSDKLAHPEVFAEIITSSTSMRSIFQYVEAIATSPRPVLITGETGVGKELIAKAVHALSNRKGAFVAVNVAGLDDQVFSDTLFGHGKGAFTDAHEARSGLVERASGGTLFLDEIGDLNNACQVKILRLLQEGEYRPLGSDVAKRSDARILVATNQELDALQSSGKFRKDLYHRLGDHHIHIPPLRNRREDLDVLLAHFLDRASETLGKKKPTPPEELVTLLRTYHFPGNVRELEAMVYDAVSSHKSGKLSMDVFKSHITKTHPGTSTDTVDLSAENNKLINFDKHKQLPTLKQAEKLLIDEAMRRSDGKQSIAAGLLGISRQALNKRLKKVET
ncbi:MAG: sigma-54-dependent Fis family transcriptional regulator [Deltaproteobacteria bacterium]|nr:MAG: sigma-54-dependent Fis family transcriptional regulator [Deltaproteobacteria bacterium]